MAHSRRVRARVCVYVCVCLHEVAQQACCCAQACATTAIPLPCPGVCEYFACLGVSPLQHVHPTPAYNKCDMPGSTCAAACLLAHAFWGRTFCMPRARMQNFDGGMATYENTRSFHALEVRGWKRFSGSSA